MLIAFALVAATLHVALPAATIDGVPTLGQTVPQVEAAFGAPVRIERFPNRRDLLYRRFEVITKGPFDDPANEVAWALDVTDYAATIAGIPRALTATMPALERELRGTPLREERRYHCDARGCFGTFFSADGRRRVIYGVHGDHHYLAVEDWPLP